jgi:copper(I)-binding protein
MRPAGDQTLPAGGGVRFEPGGLHLMLMQPKSALKVGDSVHFLLRFADGSALDVVAPVSVEAPSTH